MPTWVIPVLSCCLEPESSREELWGLWATQLKALLCPLSKSLPSAAVSISVSVSQVSCGGLRQSW